MEQFKASEEDWQQIELLSKERFGVAFVGLCDLRDRVAALEAKQAPGESPATAPAAPVVAVPSDQELWEVQLKVKSQSRPHIGWQVWSPESEPLIAAHRALYDHGYDHGYQQGLAAGRAEQGSSQGILDDSTPEPSDFQTLHGTALGIVDSLGRSFHLLPDILDTLRRAIHEPMAEQQAAAEATPDPEPEPVHSQYFSGHGLIAGEIDRALAEGGWTPTPEPTPEPSPSPAADGGLVEEAVRAMRAAPLGYQPEARAAILRAAGWLHREGHLSAAALLEQEANR
jgi:hypothetical protein